MTDEILEDAHKQIADAHVWRSQIAYGTCVSVDPDSLAATIIIQSIWINVCSICRDESIRVGIFETENRYGNGNASEFRGLCERHKNFGIWGL